MNTAKLKELGSFFQRPNIPMNSEVWEAGPLMVEAADTIERLEATQEGIAQIYQRAFSKDEVECPLCLEQVRPAELYCHKCEGK